MEIKKRSEKNMKRPHLAHLLCAASTFDFTLFLKKKRNKKLNKLHMIFY